MTSNYDHIHIFKSNIATEADLQIVSRVLDNAAHIEQWTIDLGDDDHVLRVVSHQSDKGSIAQLISRCGYYCEELTD